MIARTLTWTGVLVSAASLLAACAPVATTPTNSNTETVLAPPAPTPVAMDAAKALGLWSSDFGAVKIERDDSGGEGAVMGIWVYERGGQETIGFFSGELRGNVLEFTWNEPATPQELRGSGYLLFGPQGTQFSGRWWTDDRTRGGMWSGQRSSQSTGTGSDTQGGAYGGSTYGGSTYGGAAAGNRDT